MVFEVGRLVIKVAGRDAGRLGVVVKKLDDIYVLVTGPKELTGVRRRKVNIRHLVPLEEKIDIPEEASDDVVKEKLIEIIKNWPEEKIKKLKINKKLIQ